MLDPGELEGAEIGSRFHDLNGDRAGHHADVKGYHADVKGYNANTVRRRLQLMTPESPPESPT